MLKDKTMKAFLVTYLCIGFLFILGVCRACDDFGIAGCNGVYARELEARKGADQTSPEYELSCTYLQIWYDCLEPKKFDCKSEHVFLTPFSDAKTRLTASPYNCRLSDGMSPMVSLAALLVSLLVSMEII